MKITNLILILFCSFLAVAQPTKTDELYAQRLSTLKSQLDFTYHPEVKKYIDQYLENPEKTRELIGLSKVYFPVIEKALRVKNVPTDLKYMAMAVSELNPSAENMYGATGNWMMMYNVSKMYKLKVNSFVDERRDPVKAANAAASHFKDLYSIYKQWPLAIAAYGCSPVMLNKCIRMANNSLYFWEIFPYIPENSRGLYPKVIATAYILNFYREHGIKPVFPDLYNETDSAMVNKWLSFQQISVTLDIPLEQLRKLNPSFKKDIIPFTEEGYWIKLPKNKGKQFELLKDSVYNPLPKQQDFVPVSIQKLPEDTTKVATATSQPLKEPHANEKRIKRAKVLYTVKKGDNLADIADWFDTTPDDIKEWNALKGTIVPKGKKLKLFVDAKKTGYYKRINTMNASQKKKLKRKD
ncbi:MAG: transglycosylase SLT domain-containing protein [Bacteroidota bacterium]